MAQKKVAVRVEELAEPLVKAAGMELVDVEYVREQDWILRVYIDKEGGVDLTDCQTMSEALSTELDKADFIANNYLLEVSSPGIDRVLKKDRDFDRYAGSEVDVKLYSARAGHKEFTATLLGYTETALQLETEAGKEEIPRADIATVRLHVSF
ncbi:ribosome maturation factor RimP [Negativicoccus succinicivorans]|uniref:Ribosome maturation factor RimP n=1 Tax=Negativicoccus succinicivorans TaxID=620903 RepID=A0A841R2Q0_9FIRM|nr:ribosome maturation factor RimP [Negativicoccus succinicivorans]KGF11208.1 hypothetical protein HMPREF1633_06685 [Tissierellia bacterium S5-A11]MBB6478086.1 ribosome maturation factor RimP [Negativicoccus succinicivorans]MBS6028141.1 ribosome maturation factor RimP [Negativicoccus succinicivorans]MDU1056371.1 ribosome maturation factor RimP [Negativicoccus succinicivorans]MDU2096361.1 ribosome maturation factor RimP [Negativicoccus succinicivorans]